MWHIITVSGHTKLTTPTRLQPLSRVFFAGPTGILFYFQLSKTVTQKVMSDHVKQTNSPCKQSNLKGKQRTKDNF